MEVWECVEIFRQRKGIMGKTAVLLRTYGYSCKGGHRWKGLMSTEYYIYI